MQRQRCDTDIPAGGVPAAEASLRLHETDQAKQWLAEAPVEHRGWKWRYLSLSDASQPST